MRTKLQLDLGAAGPSTPSDGIEIVLNGASAKKCRCKGAKYLLYQQILLLGVFISLEYRCCKLGRQRTRTLGLTR